jgi:hypothetical protein
MKKINFLLAAILFSVSVFSQSEKYAKTMESRIQNIETTRNPDELKELANAFERIADAEKNQWHPYYYAALSTVNIGYSTMTPQGGDAKIIDPIADKAEALLKKAEALQPANSDIFIVKKMIASLRMMADPMNRYIKYGPEAQQALEAAKKLNPDNPRIYMLEGQDKFHTPEQFGGSKEEAKKLFALAMQKFENEKPATSIDPRWGKATTEYFIKLAN